MTVHTNFRVNNRAYTFPVGYDKRLELAIRKQNHTLPEGVTAVQFKPTGRLDNPSAFKVIASLQLPDLGVRQVEIQPESPLPRTWEELTSRVSNTINAMFGREAAIKTIKEVFPDAPLDKTPIDTTVRKMNLQFNEDRKAGEELQAAKTSLNKLLYQPVN